MKITFVVGVRFVDICEEVGCVICILQWLNLIAALLQWVGHSFDLFQGACTLQICSKVSGVCSTERYSIYGHNNSVVILLFG